MKRIQYIMVCLLMLMAAMHTACKKFVDINAPTNSLVTKNVFNTDATATTTQLAVYAKMAGSIYQLDQISGLSSDELTNYSTGQYYIDVYRNNLTAQNDGGMNGQWAGIYNIIYQENAILENVKASSGMSDRVKNLLTGEAKFTRAWQYFQLVNMFGDVPLITTTDYSINSVLSRSSKDNIFGQIIQDLLDAQSLLSTSYLDGANNTGANDRIRPTTWAADALLARVYLYVGKYDLAEQQSNLVINNKTLFNLETDLTKVFKSSSKEAIWQLIPPSGTLYTQEGNNLSLQAPPIGSGYAAAISQQLLSAFEINDTRKTTWINTYTQGTSTWPYPFKYRDNNKATSLSEYSMVLRLAEIILIRAEARAQQNKITGANSAETDLNLIRNRAGLPNTNANTLSGMLSAIAHERQVELFCENDRWFDLKRTKSIDAVMTISTSQKGGAWNSYQQLYPLALNDLQLDPNLMQNPGY